MDDASLDAEIERLFQAEMACRQRTARELAVLLEAGERQARLLGQHEKADARRARRLSIGTTEPQR